MNANHKAQSLLIRVYGDSLSMPRHLSSIRYRDIYTELLRNDLETRGVRVSLYNRSSGGATLGHLYSGYSADADYFGPEGDSIIIVQAGVVDCAPHCVPMFLQRAIGRLPMFARNWTINKIRQVRPTLLEKRISSPLTKETEFNSLLSKWVKSLSLFNEHTLFINICPTTESGERRLPGFSENINKYNRLIREAVQGYSNASVVDAYSAIRASDNIEKFVDREDGHHLTRQGHELYCELLMEEIGKLL